MKNLLTLAITLVAALPGNTFAQPPGPPRMELGAQASMQTSEERAITWSPRITLNLSPTTALEATADFRRPGSSLYGVRTSGETYSLHWRQALFTKGRWQFSGVLGAGARRRVQRFPERIFDGPDGPAIVPPEEYVESGLAVHVGPAVQFEAAPWLALRGDVRLTASQSGGVRGMIGAAVPLGRFRAGDRPVGREPAPVAEWQRVKPGREVWVTTNAGTLVHGEVSAVSGRSLQIRHRTGEAAITFDDIRVVEGRDGLRNGIVIGGASGALGGGLLFTLAASVACESDPCDPIAVVAFAFGAASGAAVGGLLGAMVDGLIPGKQTLFERSAVRLKPVVTSRSKAIGVTMEWR